MRRILSIVMIFIFFLLIYLIQSNIFVWFNIFGVMPNLFIMLAVFLGLFLEKKHSMVISIVLGLLLDFFIGRKVGVNALIMCIASLIGNRCDESFSKDSRLTIMIIMMSSTLACELIVCILQIIEGTEVILHEFLKILLIEVIYNMFIVIIAYRPLQRIGQKLEDIFEKNKFKSIF